MKYSRSPLVGFKKYLSLTSVFVIILLLCFHLVRGCSSNYAYQRGKGYLKIVISDKRYDSDLARFAELSLTEALHSDPGNADILYELGKLHYYRAYYSEEINTKESRIEALMNARQQFKGALRIKPTDGYYHIYYALVNTNILQNRVSDPKFQSTSALEQRSCMDLAKKHFEAAIVLDPNNRYINEQYKIWKGKVGWIFEQK
jgi:tetratricopeptide (TPR) repeat protein